MRRDPRGSRRLLLAVLLGPVSERLYTLGATREAERGVDCLRSRDQTLKPLQPRATKPTTAVEYPHPLDGVAQLLDVHVQSGAVYMEAAATSRHLGYTAVVGDALRQERFTLGRQLTCERLNVEPMLSRNTVPWDEATGPWILSAHHGIGEQRVG
jgi:hypothetical protein